MNKTQKELEMYVTASNICKKVFNEVKDMIQSALVDNKCLSILELQQYSNKKLLEECNQVFKKEKVKGIAFPTAISINECVSNYVHEPNKNDKINKNDLIKIEMGVNIGGCIVVLGETISNNDEDMVYIKFLDSLSKKVIEHIQPGQTNDDVRILVESKCTQLNCFPIENCMSYQVLDGHLRTEDSKYIVLNHQKYYDNDDNLTVEPNLCFEFEKGEVYNINLTILPEQETEHVFKEFHSPHIYRFNEYFYNVKMKCAKEFINKVKKTHGNNAFVLHNVIESNRDKLGFKECYENGLLEEYPVLYNKHHIKSYSKKFTVIVNDKKCTKY
jgi:methionine aminopeptidase